MLYRAASRSPDRLPAALLLLICCTYAHAAVLDLSKQTWVMSNAGGTLQLQTTLPSYALAELQHAGVIQDPLHGFGETEYAWVAREQWRWCSELQLASHHPLLLATFVMLHLEGVDTSAQVTVNKQVDIVNSYHRTWHLLLQPGTLQLGNNSICITINPAASEAIRLKAQSSYPIPTMKAPGMMDAYNFLRKPASDFGWDWGPAFAPSGIHGRVQLLTWDQPRLIGVHFHQQHSDTADVPIITLTVAALLLVPPTGGARVVTLLLPELGVKQERHVPDWGPSLSGSQQNVTFTIPLMGSDVKLWWPVGQGNQTLYQMQVVFQPGMSSRHSTLPCVCEHSFPKPDRDCCQTITKWVGFRHVELVRDPVPTSSSTTPGESCYFRVNGIPVYAKGANVIPLHTMAPMVTWQRLRGTLEAALAANMNMLRIWGGGRYQTEDFYDWCDKHGMLVWQETMFACSPYPRDAAFLEDVRAEVREQVMRLSSHPSIVVWGGNNEIETSLGWYEETRSNPHLFAVDYAALFLEVIQLEVQELLPNFPFVDSSPSNGHWPERPDVKRWGDAQDPRFGDVHYYNYADDCQDWRVYPQARFISEYGWQSYPTWATYSAATSPADWNLASNMTEFRQRHPQGTQELLAQLRRHFKLPSSWLVQSPAATSSAPSAGLMLHLPAETAHDSHAAAASTAHGRLEIQTWLYLVQVQQLQCYSTALGLWRRLRGNPSVQTMGVLYWQLNDVWAGASWSSLDYGLQWKPLHYEVKRLFAQLAVTIHEEDSQLQVHLISDLQEAQDVLLLVYVHSLDDGASACRHPEPPPWRPGGAASTAASPFNPMRPVVSLRVHVTGNNATLVWQHSTQDLLQLRPGCNMASCYVHVRIMPASSGHSEGGAATAQDMAQQPAEGQVNPRQQASAGPLWLIGGSRRRAAGQGAGRGVREVALAEATYFLTPFKDMQLPDPQLQVSPLALVGKGTQAGTSSTGAPRAQWHFSVSSSRPALYALWGLPEGLPGLLDSASWFSDNAVVVHPCHPRHVTLHVTPGSTLAHHLQKRHKQIQLQATSLYDYQDVGRWQGAAPATGHGGTSVRSQLRPLLPDVLEL